jgi:hypothetical protein
MFTSSPPQEHEQGDGPDLDRFRPRYKALSTSTPDQAATLPPFRSDRVTCSGSAWTALDARVQRILRAGAGRLGSAASRRPRHERGAVAPTRPDCRQYNRIGLAFGSEGRSAPPAPTTPTRYERWPGLPPHLNVRRTRDLGPGGFRTPGASVVPGPRVRLRRDRSAWLAAVLDQRDVRRWCRMGHSSRGTPLCPGLAGRQLAAGIRRPAPAQNAPSLWPGVRPSSGLRAASRERRGNPSAQGSPCPTRRRESSLLVGIRASEFG